MSVLGLAGAEDARDSAASYDKKRLQLEIDRDRFNKEQVEEMNQWTREDRLDFLERRDRERGMLDPVQQGLVDRAMEGPDYAGAMARSDSDVAQTFGIARDAEQRHRSRYGINIASPAAASMARRSFNEEALAKVGGRHRARLAEDDRDWARKLAALGTGNMRNATPNANLAQLGVSGASGVMGGMAQGYRADAAGGYALFGKAGADALDSYDRYNTRKPSVGGGGINYDMYGEDAVN